MDALITLLIPLLIQVESGGRADAVGDGGKAVGVLQIHECVIQDVNRVYQTKYTPADRLNKAKSMSICRLYLKYYGTRYQLKTGKKATLEVLSRCWNGGPDGWKKQSTVKYWNKVKELYEQQKKKD